MRLAFPDFRVHTSENTQIRVANPPFNYQFAIPNYQFSIPLASSLSRARVPHGT